MKIIYKGIIVSILCVILLYIMVIFLDFEYLPVISSIDIIG